MRPEERHAHIFEIVSKRGRADVDELCEELGVSAMTVRRDLAVLDGEGALRRIHRGAVRSHSGSYEPPFPVRAKLNARAKRQIAAEVQTLVDDGQTVVLDAGTTGVAIAEQLVDRHITVCTPSVRVAAVLASSPTVWLMLTGGMVRPGEQSMVGEAAVQTLSQYHFDLYIMTASALHPDRGVSEWNTEDAAVKRAALRAASRSIVACDASKVGSTAFARVCDLDAVELLVTDASVPEEQKVALEAAGLKVVVSRNDDGHERAGRPGRTRNKEV